MSASSPAWARVDRGKAQRGFERRHVRRGHRVRAGDPAQTLLGDLERGAPGEDARHGGERLRIEAARTLVGQLALGRAHGLPGEARRAFGLGDPLAGAQQDVLVAREAPDPRSLEQGRQGAQRQRGDAAAGIALSRVQRLQGHGLLHVVLAARLQMQLPAVATDAHLEDLGRALVDGRDAHVAPDLLDHVLVGVAVAAEGLEARVGGDVAGLAGQVLRDGSLGDELGLAGVEPLGRLLDVRAAGFEPHGVGHDQLVGVALLLRQRRAALDALGGVGDGAIEGRPAGAEAEGRHHETRVAEDGQRLLQALAFDAAHQPIRVDDDAVERQRRGVAGADAVLVLRLAVTEVLGVALDDEPAGSAGRQGEDGEDVRHAAVADPLLAARELVADDRAVLLDGDGGGAQRREIAAGLGLGGAVGHEDALVGDASEPVLLLLRRAAHRDGIAAERGRQQAGRDAEIDARQLLAEPVDVEGAAAHAVVGLGNEEQVEAELGAAHLADDLGGELVPRVELEQAGVRQLPVGEVAQRLQDHVERFSVEA